MAGSEGKVAVVTGGGGGLGRAISLLLAARQVSVVVADVNADDGAETVKQVEEAGGKALFVPTDVSSESDVRAMVEAATANFGRLDYAFNNAGIDGDICPLAEQTVETFQRVIAVNLAGVFYGLKYEIPVMLAQGGGSIVNTSSIAGVRGHPGIGPYSAAKHGVNGLTKTAAIDYGASGIRVNSVCPGGIRTPMLDHYLAENPEMRAAVIDGNPLRRMGEAHEIAEAAVWLASDASSYVNGHELVVDGGKIASDA